MHADVTGRVETDLVVVRDIGRMLAGNDATDIQIFTAQNQLGPGCQLAVDGRRQCPGSRTDRQAIDRTVIADMVVDQDIVITVQIHMAVQIEGFEMRAVGGFQTDFTGHHFAAAVDDDVALRGQVAGNRDAIAGVDDDVGVVAAGDQGADQIDMAGRVQDHAAAQGFEDRCDAERDVLIAVCSGTGKQVNAAVSANITVDIDGTAGRIGLAEVDHRTACAGIQRDAAR